ncbi:hypothetical protein PL321_16970 [Caloramator sp. mosi_1]|nr:hypothetical protein [Caloramator sp. mosi_1]WDC85869.1 hypothetical protein PL321_16970 [Caloramator sp. mosi_1]
MVAKVERDEFMDKIALKYPFYSFEKNKGYGTKEHIEAIKSMDLVKYIGEVFKEYCLG